MNRLALFSNITSPWKWPVCRLASVILAAPQTRRDVERYRTANYRLLRWWARSLLGALRRLYRLQFAIEGDRISSDRSSPSLRHISWLDNLVAAAALSCRTTCICDRFSKTICSGTRAWMCWPTGGPRVRQP
jgi:hypothetical protein